MNDGSTESGQSVGVFTIPATVADDGQYSQLSLLPWAGRKMSTDQSAVTFCGWGVQKAGTAYSTCG